MPSAAVEPKARYAIEAQATTLFAFLRQTFSKMPRSVQVIGWLVLLLLFVFLVLYPIIGITYFNAKIVTLKKDKDGQSTYVMEKGLRVHKQNATITNDEGEFTLAVRVPSVPLMGVEFYLGSGDNKEIVSLPGPLPIISMFNPNTTKIFYVPGSNLKDKLGVTRHFFLDSDEAGEALKPSGQGKVTSTSGEASFASLLIERMGSIGIAHAAVPQYREQTYTLQMQELKISEASSKTGEIYFAILIDGAPIQLRGIPNSDSRKADYLTVFAGIPIKMRGMDIPVPKSSKRVEIAVKSPGLFKDATLGSVVFDVKPQAVGKIIKQNNRSIELSVELMPPLAIKYTSIKDQTNFRAVMWLDVPREYLKDVATLTYQFADGDSVGAPAIRKQDYFSYVVNFWQPEVVAAQITFASGGSIKVGAYVEPKRGEGKSALDYYQEARLSYIAGNYTEALRWLDKANQLEPTIASSSALRATILANIGKYEEALKAFDQALAEDPNDATTLNAYAWVVADILPNPSHAQLLRARERAQSSARILPRSGAYDTLGWVQFKLREYPAALETLTSARAMQQRLGKTDSDWQEINFHLAQVYLQLGKKQEAQEALQEVVEYAEQFGVPTPAIQKYHAEAKVQLKKLQ